MALVTRFHLLIFGVTLAIAGVIVFRVPADFAFPAHWSGSGADWTWPRDGAIAVAPAVQLALLAGFFVLGRLLTPGHLERTRHVLDAGLTLLLAVALACQMALLLLGIGADLDLFRIIAFGLAVVLLGLGAVLFEAERHTYGGLRLPWPIAGDRAWRRVHRGSGVASALAGLGLAGLAWTDPGPGLIVLAMALVLAALPLLAGLLTLALDRRSQ
jgi:hypothetical protein